MYELRLWVVRARALGAELTELARLVTASVSRSVALVWEDMNELNAAVIEEGTAAGAASRALGSGPPWAKFALAVAAFFGADPRLA
jgi:hypothetical protein